MNKNVIKLFEDRDETMIRSCLQGCMGRIVVDNEENPSSAMADIGAFCFFVGTPNEDLFKDIDGLKFLVPSDIEWERLIENHYGKRVNKTLRYAIKKEENVFDREKLTKIIGGIDNRYKIRLFDKELFQMALEEVWSVDLCSQFSDYEDYNSRAFGVGILYDGKLVAGASPYAVYNEGIEIEIDTSPLFRRKGLATACGAKLILECLDRGLYPGWDAYNLTSVALAEKLGYHVDKPYVTYELVDGMPERK